MTNAPRILILDIETAPIKANIWRVWKENVGVNQIERDSYVVSWSAKWFGEKEVMYLDQRHRRDPEDDRQLVKRLWKLMDRAHIVVAHNGKAFDIPVLNARFIEHGLKPPSSYRIVDTLLIARKYFRFTFNSLEYLTQKLCKKYKKLKHEKYPGFELWNECVNKHNMDAWAEMEKYNRHDVLALEELYEIMRPWDKDTNYFIYQSEGIQCRCGSKHYKRNGWHYNLTRMYRRFRCKACGHEWRDSKAFRSTRYTSAITR